MGAGSCSCLASTRISLLAHVERRCRSAVTGAGDLYAVSVATAWWPALWRASVGRGTGVLG
jgi:hypothetical protein